MTELLSVPVLVPVGLELLYRYGRSLPSKVRQYIAGIGIPVKRFTSRSLLVRTTDVHIHVDMDRKLTRTYILLVLVPCNYM